MRKLINQIFLIPIFLIIFGLIVFTIFYTFFVEDLTQKEFQKVNNIVLNNEKKF
ncbi:hypothetical protein [Nautilia sp. PV-1]|uniref:hypothetical protein n=1 Tax=Nautilia sp. PV-1 TaxID=2579250 RepID=UPI001438C24B|nr:hypothetical protein [Nautilia sp. PV-1]